MMMPKNAELVYVRYKDHVLFRNTDPKALEPDVRETVGWLLKEDDDSILILWDRSVKKLPHERACLKESGLVILKADIMELKRIA
ncbi:MAG: hypothetical protein ACUVTD_04750 [Nitrososphaerales archaeon]